MIRRQTQLVYRLRLRLAGLVLGRAFDTWAVLLDFSRQARERADAEAKLEMEREMLRVHQEHIASKTAHRHRMICKARYFDLWVKHMLMQSRLKRCLFRAMGHNQSMRLASSFELWRSAAVTAQQRVLKGFRVRLRLESLLLGRTFDAWHDARVTELQRAAVHEKIGQNQLRRAMTKWMKRAEAEALERERADAEAKLEMEREMLR
eukprot:SAG31_NODE_14668_length_793_cov_1.714697_1_plen_205_part_10